MNKTDQAAYQYEGPVFPHEPKEYQFKRYALPEVFDNPQQAEAAARLICYCQQVGSWLGVSSLHLKDQMQFEIRANEDYQALRSSQWHHEYASQRARRRHSIFQILTLGGYGLFVPKPSKPKKLDLSPVRHLPKSGIYEFGTDYVWWGFRELEKGGFVRMEKGKSGDKIIYPTLRLIEALEGCRLKPCSKLFC